MKRYLTGFSLIIVLIFFIVSCSKNSTPSNSSSTSCIKITLTSPVGTDSQTVGIGIPIKPITYEISNNVSSDTSGLSAISVGILGALPGITSSFSGDVFTLSGSPSTATGSPFVYEVVATGNVCDASVKGVVSVKTCGTIQLTSDLSTMVQKIPINTSLVPITYAIGGGATGAIAANLPHGVTGIYSNGVFQISGKPDSASIYQYTVTSTGGYCSTIDTGYITATNCPAIILTSDSSTISQTVAAGQNITPITYTLGGDYSHYEIISIQSPPLTYTLVNGVLTITGQVYLAPDGENDIEFTIYLYPSPNTPFCSGAVSNFKFLIK
ncbi:MAG TPA: hypothetical protein VNW49_06640 [Puia sp.]|nr:hypothetical protein [Puia sp.]